MQSTIRARPAFAGTLPLSRFSRISATSPVRRTRQSQAARWQMSSGGQRRSILVFGGGSTLGKEVAEQFTADGWAVVTLDYFDASVECGGVNGCAIPKESAIPIGLALPAGAPARTQAEVAARCLNSSCAGPFDVVLNATLGFAAAGLRDDDLFETAEYMHRTSVESSLVTAKLASQFLANDGLLALIGSVAALAGTHAPRLLGFGMAKASVHQLVKLLAGSVGEELPKGSGVIGLVPEVIDTPLHRSMNNGEPSDNWTPSDAVAEKLLFWANNPNLRPPNASLVAIATSTAGRDEEAKERLEHRFRLIQDASFVQSAQL